jgi:type IV pilus assembly protein PilC
VIFVYAARHSNGTAVKGSIDAPSRDAALAHLRSRALYVTLLETAATARGALTSLTLSLGRNQNARTAFFRAFATMVGAGIAIKDALETATAQCGDRTLAEALRSVAADVEGGVALSAAMLGHPKEFSAIAVAIVKAGEVAGSLDESLRCIAELEERDRTLRRRIVAALAYPAVVAVAAAGLLTFLIAGTMPGFAAMFEQMHVALPPATRFLIALGGATHSWLLWVAVVAAPIGVYAGFKRIASADDQWALAIDRIRLSLPIAGTVIGKSIVARFARTLGESLRAGVDAIVALEAAMGVVDSAVFRDGIGTVVKSLRAGETLSSALESTALFDGTFLQLARAGEQSGALDALMLRVAGYYEIDVEAALATFTSIVEPALICFLGAAIGTIVASVIVPLYSMIGNIR